LVGYLAKNERGRELNEKERETYEIIRTDGGRG